MTTTLHREIAETRDYQAGALALGGETGTPGCEATLPRYAARRDTNHAEIRDGLRAAGFSVFDAGGVGANLPDLIVGAYGRFTFLVEVKSPGGKVSAGQSAFARDWRGGPVFTVYSLEQALADIIKHVRGDKPLAPYGHPPIAWGA